MKKRTVQAVALLTAFLTAAAVFAGCGALNPPEISDVVTFRFGCSGGMERYSGYAYGATEKDGQVTVSIRLSGAADEDALVLTDPDYPVMERLREIIETYELNRWDGFDKRNKNAVDGSSFSLYVQMDNGEEIQASGYMKYPSGYGEAAGAIGALFLTLYAQATAGADGT